MVKVTVEVPALKDPAVFDHPPPSLIADPLAFNVPPLMVMFPPFPVDIPQLLPEVSTVPPANVRLPVGSKTEESVHVADPLKVTFQGDEPLKCTTCVPLPLNV